jgi:hypothetical protein
MMLRVLARRATAPRHHHSRKVPVPTRSSGAKPATPGAPGSVDALLASLDHPRAREIDRVRQLVRDADPRIEEGVKWNAPSFRTSEWFATIHLRARDGVQVILHRGAKRRDDAVAIADPASLLAWLGADRASVTFRDAADIEARSAAFQEVVRQWIERV